MDGFYDYVEGGGNSCIGSINTRAKSISNSENSGGTRSNEKFTVVEITKNGEYNTKRLQLDSQNKKERQKGSSIKSHK